MSELQFRNGVFETYADVYTSEVLAALSALAPLNKIVHDTMMLRNQRRKDRYEQARYLDFLDPETIIKHSGLKVADIRNGQFTGSDIPSGLKCQWIQGTGPAARPGATLAVNLRNVAYALLSGADGWMFDSEDALGQVSTMSLDHQRSLKLAIARDPLFLQVAEQVAREMNRWSAEFFGRDIIDNWELQLDFTTIMNRSRGLHLDDRHIRLSDGSSLAASIVDTVLFVVNNYQKLREKGRPMVLYIPKIQTAQEAAVWNLILDNLEDHLSLVRGAIKAYLLVEQLEATYQLMEIRAVMGPHFVGYNTGRWDYINSVADAMGWDHEFVNPDIEEIGMTYAYMRHYEDRVRRVVNTATQGGHHALWQGGMEPNIPVGSKEGVEASMKKAIAGAVREEEAGASGKWVAHWKMVHIVRPVWEKKAKANQLGRKFPPIDYTKEAARALIHLEPARRSIRGARNLLSVALQYGNAFGQGLQAAALKPADFFGNDDVLYLMEDMATGEIRVSILWEWVHKGGVLTVADPELSLSPGEVFTAEIFKELLEEEYAKLLVADPKDVFEESKTTTLPIAKEIVEKFVLSPVKFPWYIDLLNLNLNNFDLEVARERIELYIKTFESEGRRITENLDF